MSGEPIATNEYESWLSELFSSSEFRRIGLVSAGISIALFIGGYVIATVGGLSYLTITEGYLGAFSVFWMLTLLGFAENSYIDIWNDVRPAFAVDDETYDQIIRSRLERIHDIRHILGYTALLLVPYLIITGAIYLPGSPFRVTGVKFFLGGSSDYDPSFASFLVLSLLGIPNSVLLATFLNGFLNHLALVREVSRLPFDDIHTSASDLEPVAVFTITGATVWFAGASLIVVWIRAGISETVGVTMIAVVVFVGIVFFLAPQLLLHDALLDAKRNEIVTIREEYDRLHKRLQTQTESSEDLSLRLEVIDRRLESAKAIRTWVYDLSSVGKLVSAALIPWLTLIQRLVAAGEIFA